MFSLLSAHSFLILTWLAV
uniref:Uncharacterized protein n=1 Tax=Anguilla anguilla TaxID=7936 RepID=A0A0E9RGN8_ANGAN